MVPVKKSTDTPLLKEYIYCRDLEGERWTIPRGSKLHLELWADVQQGYPDPFVPVELIREPWRGLTWDIEGKLESGIRSWVFLNAAEKHGLYRLGQFVRLQHRRKATSNG